MEKKLFNIVMILCLMIGPAEEFEATDPDWYNKLYDEKVYIPINKFCMEDYPIIFTKEFVKKLQDRNPTYSAKNFNNEKIYLETIPRARCGVLYPAYAG